MCWLTTNRVQLVTACTVPGAFTCAMQARSRGGSEGQTSVINVKCQSALFKTVLKWANGVCEMAGNALVFSFWQYSEMWRKGCLGETGIGSQKEVPVMLTVSF